MWILVIAILASGGASIATVPGFPDVATCKAAGDQWKAKMAALPDESEQLWEGRAPAQYLCFSTAAPN